MEEVYMSESVNNYQCTDQSASDAYQTSSEYVQNCHYLNDKAVSMLECTESELQKHSIESTFTANFCHSFDIFNRLDVNNKLNTKQVTNFEQRSSFLQLDGTICNFSKVPIDQVQSENLSTDCTDSYESFMSPIDMVSGQFSPDLSELNDDNKTSFFPLNCGIPQESLSANLVNSESSMLSDNFLELPYHHIDQRSLFMPSEESLYNKPKNDYSPILQSGLDPSYDQFFGAELENVYTATNFSSLTPTLKPLPNPVFSADCSEVSISSFDETFDPSSTGTLMSSCHSESSDYDVEGQTDYEQTYSQPSLHLKQTTDELVTSKSNRVSILNELAGQSYGLNVSTIPNGPRGISWHQQSFSWVVEWFCKKSGCCQKQFFYCGPINRRCNTSKLISDKYKEACSFRRSLPKTAPALCRKRKRHLTHESFIQRLHKSQKIEYSGVSKCDINSDSENSIKNKQCNNSMSIIDESDKQTVQSPPPCTNGLSKKKIGRPGKSGNYTTSTISTGIYECTIQGRMYIRAMWTDPSTRSRCQKYFKQDEHGREIAIKLAKNCRESGLNKSRNPVINFPQPIADYGNTKSTHCNSNTTFERPSSCAKEVFKGRRLNSDPVNPMLHEIKNESYDGNPTHPSTPPSFALDIAVKAKSLYDESNDSVMRDMRTVCSTPKAPCCNRRKQLDENVYNVYTPRKSQDISSRSHDSPNHYYKNLENQSNMLEDSNAFVNSPNSDPFSGSLPCTPKYSPAMDMPYSCYRPLTTDLERHNDIRAPKVYPIIVNSVKYWRVEWISPTTNTKVYQHFSVDAHGEKDSEIMANEYGRKIHESMLYANMACPVYRQSSQNAPNNTSGNCYGICPTGNTCWPSVKTPQSPNKQMEMGYCGDSEKHERIDCPLFDNPMYSECSTTEPSTYEFLDNVESETWSLNHTNSMGYTHENQQFPPFHPEHSCQDTVHNMSDSYHFQNNTVIPSYDYPRNRNVNQQPRAMTESCNMNNHRNHSIAQQNSSGNPMMQDNDCSYRYASNTSNVGTKHESFESDYRGVSRYNSFHNDSKPKEFFNTTPTTSCRSGQRVPGRIYMLTIRDVKCWRAEWYDKTCGKRMTRQFAESVHGADAARLKSLQVLVQCDCVPDNLAEEARKVFGFRSNLHQDMDNCMSENNINLCNRSGGRRRHKSPPFEKHSTTLDNSRRVMCRS